MKRPVPTGSQPLHLQVDTERLKQTDFTKGTHIRNSAVKEEIINCQCRTIKEEITNYSRSDMKEAKESARIFNLIKKHIISYTNTKDVQRMKQDES